MLEQFRIRVGCRHVSFVDGEKRGFWLFCIGVRKAVTDTPQEVGKSWLMWSVCGVALSFAMVVMIVDLS